MAKSMYEAMMDGSLWKEMENSTTTTTKLDTVTDTNGNLVNIELNVITAQDGRVLDRSILAAYPDGVLYPEWADEKVKKAIAEAAQKVNGTK